MACKLRTYLYLKRKHTMCRILHVAQWATKKKHRKQHIAHLRHFLFGSSLLPLPSLVTWVLHSGSAKIEPSERNIPGSFPGQGSMKIPAIMRIFIAFVVASRKVLRTSGQRCSRLIPRSGKFLVARIKKRILMVGSKDWLYCGFSRPSCDGTLIWNLICPTQSTVQHPKTWEQFSLKTGSDGHHRVH